MKYLITLLLLTVTFTLSASDLRVEIPEHVYKDKKYTKKDMPFSVSADGVVSCESECKLSLIHIFEDESTYRSSYRVCKPDNSHRVCAKGWNFRVYSENPSPLTGGYNVVAVN